MNYSSSSSSSSAAAGCSIRVAMTLLYRCFAACSVVAVVAMACFRHRAAAVVANRGTVVGVGGGGRGGVLAYADPPSSSADGTAALAVENDAGRRRRMEKAATAKPTAAPTAPSAATASYAGSSVDNFDSTVEPQGGDDGDDESVREFYIEQPLDHFFHAARAPGRYEGTVFRQRYFYSDRYAIGGAAAGEGGEEEGEGPDEVLALLCVGGESGLERSVLAGEDKHCAGDMLEFARAVAAGSGDGTGRRRSVHLYALEHRYYGRSYPSYGVEKGEDEGLGGGAVDSDQPLLGVDSLVYLTSRQALADIGRFIDSRNAANGWATSSSSAAANSNGSSASTSTKVKWIAFGSSYAGMISAWSRLKMPRKVFAAVSNSAPVRPVLSFSGYKDRAADALRSPDVGGSDQCLEIVRGGHAALSKMVADTSLHADIARDFELCDPDSLRDERNLRVFLGDGVFDLIDFNVQRDDPGCAEPLCNIRKICSALVDRVDGHNSSQVDALSWVLRERRQHRRQLGVPTVMVCIDIDFDVQVTQGYSNSLYRLDDLRRSLRAWLWQTCNEFGFYQVCEIGSQCPYGIGFHSLSDDLSMCREGFGIDAKQAADNVRLSLDHFGGWEPWRSGSGTAAATRILSVVGTVDPWTELSVPASLGTPEAPVLVVNGASHHFWTHPPRPDDSVAVRQARATITDTLRRWTLDRSEGVHEVRAFDPANRGWLLLLPVSVMFLCYFHRYWLLQSLL